MIVSKPIYITGMMGSGKSFWGRQLSDAAGIPLTDLDLLIQKNAGRTISNIFEESGEPMFRQLEKKALEDTFIQAPAIIATGGGTPCFFDNMLQMNNHGITIWLQCSLETLTQRLLPEQAHRPLLKNMDVRSLQKLLQQKFMEREPFYSQCHYHIPESDQTLSHLISKISTHA